MMKTNEIMTNEEYVEAGGLQCPYCKSDDIAGQSFDGEGRHVWSVIHCNECGADWMDIYTLTGFEQIGDNNET